MLHPFFVTDFSWCGQRIQRMLERTSRVFDLRIWNANSFSASSMRSVLLNESNQNLLQTVHRRLAWAAAEIKISNHTINLFITLNIHSIKIQCPIHVEQPENQPFHSPVNVIGLIKPFSRSAVSFSVAQKEFTIVAKDYQWQPVGQLYFEPEFLTQPTLISTVQLMAEQPEHEHHESKKLHGLTRLVITIFLMVRRFYWRCLEKSSVVTLVWVNINGRREWEGNRQEYFIFSIPSKTEKVVAHRRFKGELDKRQ